MEGGEKRSGWTLRKVVRLSVLGVCLLPIALLAVAFVVTTINPTLIQSHRDYWSKKPLTLYCAHDLPFVEDLVREFERTHDVRVSVVADTEATKSLGLVRRIVAERDAPQADVFWNNQLLGTLELAEQGLLAPLDVPNAERFPGRHRGETWCGFGGRARVWILDGGNTDEVFELDAGELLPSGPDFCVADPMFGTTLTHAALLWDRAGEDRFRAWYESLPETGTRVVPGNSATRDLVVAGTCRRGWTDTDDAFGAIDDWAEVTFQPVLVDGEAIVKDAPHPEAARQFADWLLSEAVERKLAAGAARQIPLGSLSSPDLLPADVEGLRSLAGNAVDLRGLLSARRAVLEYLSRR